jgi:plasmid stability protein
MRELGRRGGRTPKMTALRRAAADKDDSLREQAREVLARALAGDDVPKPALDSARSLFSYRADAPPVGEQPRDNPVGLASGRKVVGLADVLELAVDEAHGFLDDARMQDVVLRAAERVHELQARGVRVESPKT